MADSEKLIPTHGGYRNLKTFQLAQLIYDITVRFCQRYIDKYSRTNDQMVQAARSGVQNIAEGSQASGTSKKTELKLTNVARASLEELKLDYEDYLRQRQLEVLLPDSFEMIRFKGLECSSMDQFSDWVNRERQFSKDSHRHSQANKDNSSVQGGDSQCQSYSSATLAANGALSLLNLTCYLLDKQIAAQAKAFENEGGFTERLYRVRFQKRNNYGK